MVIDKEEDQKKNLVRKKIEANMIKDMQRMLQKDVDIGLPKGITMDYAVGLWRLQVRKVGLICDVFLLYSECNQLPGRLHARAPTV